jgi:DDE family transposase
MSEQKWVRSSLVRLSRELTKVGHAVSPPTVARLLRRLSYGLHGNQKRVEGSATPPERDAQFRHIQGQRQAFAAAGQPVISVDTKKKELLGNFKNGGRSWSQSGEAVNVHDFPGDALGRAVPYGIYDLTHNRGSVSVGLSGDTPRFAVDVVAGWWQQEGGAAFPGATEVLILADAGGNNSARSRVWKEQLQAQLCDGFGLTVTVCHYPPGCSKWNPIEHRLFGPISSNWAGQPLRTLETMLGYLRGTTTQTGLVVRARRQDGEYPTGERVSDATMASLQLERHAICPTWNYTLRPRPAPAAPTLERELVS